MSALESKQAEDREIEVLLRAVFERYGYDFRDYAFSSLRRRIRRCMQDEMLESLPEYGAKLLRDAACMEKFLRHMSVAVTTLFRDPAFFRALRSLAISWLASYPFIRVWVAGCSTGEEAYSLAIMFHEAGLYDRTRIYATDISSVAIAHAKEGIFPEQDIETDTKNYQDAGGLGFLSDWYTTAYGSFIMHKELKENMVFAVHNLATDSVFNEFHLILCRNVMIYFNERLQARVHRLIYDSLHLFGILGIGMKEFLWRSPHETCYETLDEANKIYRRVR